MTAWNKKKPLSKKQKANLLTGQLLFKCECTQELIKFLEENGFRHEALTVEGAHIVARTLAHRLGKEAIAEANKDV
jgi:hypothetical protein